MSKTKPPARPGASSSTAADGTPLDVAGQTSSRPAERRYARIYHDFRTEQPEVFRDAILAGTFLQCYVAADMAFPSAADVPRYVEATPLERLVALGEVQMEGPDVYRMPRIDEDRGPRRAHAQRAAAASHEKRGGHHTRPGQPDQTRPVSNADALQMHSERPQAVKTTSALRMDTGPLDIREPLASMPSYEEAMRLGATVNGSTSYADVREEVKVDTDE